MDNAITGDLVYTIHRDGSDQLHIYRHGREGDDNRVLLFVEKQTTSSVEQLRPGSANSSPDKGNMGA